MMTVMHFIHPREEDDMSDDLPSETRTMMRLFGTFTDLRGPGDLAVLDDYAIILTLPEEDMPNGQEPLQLCKTTDGWYSFWRNSEGRLEPIDRWTPTFPALLVLDGVEHDMIGPARRGRHAARRTDPASSHRAVRKRHPKWDSMNMRALRVFHAHRAEEFGLSYYEVEVLAADQWGQSALGKSPWKRCSELHTDFDPPLIERVRYPEGGLVEVGGEFGDPVDAFQITAAGRALVEAGEASR